MENNNENINEYLEGLSQWLAQVRRNHRKMLKKQMPSSSLSLETLTRRLKAQQEETEYYRKKRTQE